MKGLMNNTSITKLSLGMNDKFGKEGFEALSEMISKNKAIKGLILVSMGIDSESSQKLFESLAKNQSIEKLDISGNKEMGINGMKAFSKGIIENKTLKDLNLGANLFDVEMTLEMVKGLKQNESVTSFSLNSNKLMKKEGFEAISLLIKETKSLKKIDLRLTDIEDDSLDTLVDGIIGSKLESLRISQNLKLKSGKNLSKLLSNHTLKELYFGGVSIDSRAIEEICEGLSKTKNLTLLDLSENKQMGEEGIKKLSETLSNITSLTTLDLNQINLSEKSASVLFGKLKIPLKTINLFGNRDLGKNVKDLSKYIHSNTKLHELDLRDCGLDD